jgi:hypothetical protein
VTLIDLELGLLHDLGDPPEERVRGDAVDHAVVVREPMYMIG